MPRRKLSDDEKKYKTVITLDIDLDKILNDYLNDKKINRSKYIEKLIREDMEKRGKYSKQSFEK